MKGEFELESLREHPDQGPVTMLNLVKVRPLSLDGNGTGRDAYCRYLEAASAEARKRGKAVPWGGDVTQTALHFGGDADWDWALFVQYSGGAAFIDFVTCPAYLQANRHRQNGVEKHLILATKTAPAFEKRA